MLKVGKIRRMLCGQLGCNEEYLKFKAEGSFTINMQDILEEISDTIRRTSLGEADESCIYGKEVQFGSDGEKSVWWNKKFVGN